MTEPLSSSLARQGLSAPVQAVRSPPTLPTPARLQIHRQGTFALCPRRLYRLGRWRRWPGLERTSRVSWGHLWGTQGRVGQQNRPHEVIIPSQNGFRCWLPRLDSNRHRRQAFLASEAPPEWLSLQQAAIVYAVSLDLHRRSRPRRGSRIGGGLIRVRVDDLNRSPGRSRGASTASSGMLRVPGSVIAVP